MAELSTLSPLRSSAPSAGSLPIGVSTAAAVPSQRSKIHFRTRLFSA